MTSDDLIVIKKSTIAAKLGKILGSMLMFYTKLNLEITLFWRRLLPESKRNIRLVDVFVGKESGFKWLVSFIRTLLDNPITALSISTSSMYIVGNFFQGRIGEVLVYLCFFNILTMMLQILGVIDKLQGK